MKDLKTTYNELIAKAKTLMASGNISAYISTLKEVNTIKKEITLLQLVRA